MVQGFGIPRSSEFLKYLQNSRTTPLFLLKNSMYYNSLLQSSSMISHTHAFFWAVGEPAAVPTFRPTQRRMRTLNSVFRFCCSTLLCLARLTPIGGVLMSEAVTSLVTFRTEMDGCGYENKLGRKTKLESQRTVGKLRRGRAMVLLYAYFVCYVPISHGDFAVIRIQCRSFASIFVMFSQVSQTQV
jgi:hypothetical protein